MERIWLKQIREAKNIEQKEIATKAKITQACYSYIENGARNPSVNLAQKIAEILDFDWTMFFPSKKKKGNKKWEQKKDLFIIT